MNYYQILQVGDNASIDVIKAAYKALCKKYHPDIYSGDKAFAEQQMKLINAAYEALLKEHQKEDNCNYAKTNAKKAEKKYENDSPKGNNPLVYMGSKLVIDAHLEKVTVWKSSFIDAGITAAKNYIHSYKAIMNGYGRVQSIIRIELINIGLDLLNYHINSALNKGVSIIRDYGITDRNQQKVVHAYFAEYIKDSIEGCARFYRKSVSTNTEHLSDADLSIMAYKLYNLYLNLGRGITHYLKEQGLAKLPVTTIEEATFSLTCENNARTQKIKRGDMSVFRQLFELIPKTPDRIETYCLLYYLYGDPEKELGNIADFFGMKKEFCCYKDAYCKNKLRIDSALMFAKDAAKYYDPINWEIFGSFYPFYCEFERQNDITEKRTIDGYIQASSDEIREHLYYSKAELLEITCGNEEDIFTASSVFWAAMALFSMHMKTLTEKEFTAWANKNHRTLKDALHKYYAFAAEKTPHRRSSKEGSAVNSNDTSQNSSCSQYSTNASFDDAQNKRLIDAAISNNSLADVWNAVDNGNVYAEYALEKFFEDKCQKAIDSYNVTEMERILADVIKRANAGNSCALYIFAALTYKIHTRDRRNTAKAGEAAKIILKLADGGNISAISQKGFWGIHGYNDATRNKSEGVHYLQIGADHYHPVALAWLGSCYRTGENVSSRDLSKAREYLELAAMFGQVYGIKELQKLNSGNTSSSSCFITTAVCESFGKPDNCYELMHFRQFRDNWLIYQPDGKDLIQEYYSIAPKIVAEIDKKSNRQDIYLNVWRDYLQKCLAYIEAKEYGLCKQIYQHMVRTLQEKYLHSC